MTLFRRGETFQSITLPLLVNLAAGLILVLGGVVAAHLASLPWWVPLIFGLAAVGMTTFFSRRSIRRRYLELKILKALSSTRCGDYFVRLARRSFAELGIEEALKRLKRIVELRPFPNARFLADLERVVVESGDPKMAALRYLRSVPDARRFARLNVVKNVARYVGELPRDAVVVLYGYSSTVCDGLMYAGALSVPLFLAEDLQYGVDGSRAEHMIAAAQLAKAGLPATLIPFDQVPAITASGADFVRRADGRQVPLARPRQVVALLGCEAASPTGDVLIPSEVRGTPSATAKFVEVFRQTAAGMEVVPRVVIVTEGYKVSERLDSRESHAPLEPSLWRDVLYVMGFDFVRRPKKIELVALHSNDVNAFIDDTGVHKASDGLEESLRDWERQTLDRTKAPPRLEDLRSAIFDLNGVLLDDEALHFVAFSDVLGAMGQALSYEEYLRYCSGRTDMEGATGLLAAKGLGIDGPAIVEMKRDAYRRHRAGAPLQTFPAAIEFARRLHQRGTFCFLVTSCDAETASDFIAQCDLAGIFPSPRCTVEASAVDRTAVYAMARALAGDDARAVVVFDDSPVNLRAARSAGVSTIGIATTHSAGALNADVVLSGPHDLALLTETL